MKKLLLLLILPIFFIGCAKQINVTNTKLDNDIYSLISDETFGLIINYKEYNKGNLYLFTDENNFFVESLENALRKGGYSIHTSKERKTLSEENEFEISYILDVINKEYINNDVIYTIRYSFSINDRVFSKLYTVINNVELIRKSEWTFLGI